MSRSPSPRRVVITGLGLISPLGNTPESYWNALSSGQSGVRPLRSLPTGTLPVSWGAEAIEFTGHIDDFGPLEKAQKRSIRKGIKLMCREIQMAVAAAQRALSHAGLHLGDYDVDRTGVVFGSDYILTEPEEFIDAIRSCLDERAQFDFDEWPKDGLPKLPPLWLIKYLPNMPASHIAIYNDLRGPSNSLTIREASANLAVREAYQIIARGDADTILAGATGTRIHALRSLHVLLQEQVATECEQPERVSRPFDLDRCGMVLGEGAGAVILESLEGALKRGSEVFGEVIGSGSSAVMTRQGVGLYREAVRNVLQQTLSTAGLTPDDVGHIHAHGLSTHQADQQEAEAIADVFADRKSPVPVTAVKSYIGNPGAGGGILELIASILAQRNDHLFPLLNFETPDPKCPIHAVCSPETAPGDVFININFIPQGQASAIAVRKLTDLGIAS